MSDPFSAYYNPQAQPSTYETVYQAVASVTPTAVSGSSDGGDGGGGEDPYTEYYNPQGQATTVETILALPLAFTPTVLQQAAEGAASIPLAFNATQLLQSALNAARIPLAFTTPVLMRAAEGWAALGEWGTAWAKFWEPKDGDGDGWNFTFPDLTFGFGDWFKNFGGLGSEENWRDFLIGVGTVGAVVLVAYLGFKRLTRQEVRIRHEGSD